jgi:IclR family KDG regulon transcriptional repressor
MERHGDVVRNGGVYALGRRVWEVAQGWGGLELRAIVRPPMEALVALTGETVQAAQLEGVDAHYFEVCESPHPVKLSSRPGARLPAHASGVGKCLLAALDPTEARRRLGLAELPSLTSRTLTNVDELLAELARIRKRGYSTDDEEFALGLRCVAMPVHTPGGEVVAAVSVAMPEPRYNRAIAMRNRAALAETVATIERLLADAR